MRHVVLYNIYILCVLCSNRRYQFYTSSSIFRPSISYLLSSCIVVKWTWNISSSILRFRVSKNNWKSQKNDVLELSYRFKRKRLSSILQFQATRTASKLTSESSTSLKLTDGGSGLLFASTSTCSFGFDLLNRGAFSLLRSSFADVARLSNAVHANPLGRKERQFNNAWM